MLCLNTITSRIKTNLFFDFIDFSGERVDSINVKNSDYQLISESKSKVLAGKLFYFNSVSLERYFVSEMTIDEFADVVKCNYIAKKVNEILLKVEIMELEHHAQERLHWAARMVRGGMVWCGVGCCCGLYYLLVCFVCLFLFVLFVCSGNGNHKVCYHCMFVFSITDNH